MDDLSMVEADLARITAALVARKVRITINSLPAAAGSSDFVIADELASERQARHELGIRGVWVHDVKDLSPSHFLEELAADPDQIRRLVAVGATWVGPRHLAPA